jgi:hypothetical protein
VDLREIWTSVVQAQDIDRHMADNGQAPANAHLLADMIRCLPLGPSDRVLMPGAGTGQFLDAAPAGTFSSGRWVFTDLNPAFLARLVERLGTHPVCLAEVAVDDAECPTVVPPLAAVLAVLLLEHIAWRRAIAAWCALGPDWIGCIIQRNDGDARMLSPGRPLTPSMQRFRELAHPQLVAEADLTAALGQHGYTPVWREERAVPDAKVMVGKLFRFAP